MTLPLWLMMLKIVCILPKSTEQLKELIGLSAVKKVISKQ